MPINTTSDSGLSIRERLRRSRHEAISTLITQNHFSRQEQIVQRLEDLGFQATQSSISRDLNEMNVSKQGGRYVVAKAITGKITEIREFWSAGEHVVVIKTEPAEAGVVAKKLDNMEYRGHLGSVAGDDTLFVVCQTAEHKQKLLDDLAQFKSDAGK